MNATPIATDRTLTVAAFDLSLTCTGWATAGATGVVIPPSQADRGIDRLRWIRGAVLERARGCTLVALEGYSFASKGRAIISLGELGGVVRCALRDAGMVYVDVPPSCRAMFATGKGNAPKDEVLAAAIRKLGYAGHDHNVADALWLLRMATLRYTSDDLLSSLSAKQQQALASIDWPRVTGTGGVGATTSDGVGSREGPPVPRDAVEAYGIRD